jgi:hypothetical protein
MESRTKQIKWELMHVCWHLRGSISIDQAYQLAPDDREMAGKLIKENIETVKKTKLPLL